MRQRLLATLLLAAPLLIGTLGCSKKDDPAPVPVQVPASGTGTYTIDGRSVNCKATAVLGYTTTGLTLLSVQLTTTPEPASGSEVLTMMLTKRHSEPVSAYEVTDFSIYYQKVPIAVVYFDNTAAITSTSSGGLSGTFSTATRYSSVKSIITNGVFTDVRL